MRNVIPIYDAECRQYEFFVDHINNSNMDSKSFVLPLHYRAVNWSDELRLLGLPRLHWPIFLAGPLAVGPGVGPRLFVAENLEYDRRERRPRTTVSIGVDLRIRGDAVRTQESLQLLCRLERHRVIVEQFAPFEMDRAWNPAQPDRWPKSGPCAFELLQAARVPEDGFRPAHGGFCLMH